MKKKSPAPTPARRAGFERQLTGYSTLSHAAVSAVAVATTAVATLGTAPAADAQVVNLTAASFGVAAVSSRVGGLRITNQLIGPGDRDTGLLLTAGRIQIGWQVYQFNSNPVVGAYAVFGAVRIEGGDLQFAVHPGGPNLQRIAPGGPGSPINGLAFAGSAFGIRTRSTNHSSFHYGRNPVGDFFQSIITTATGYVGFRVATAGNHAYQFGWLRVGIENGIFTGDRPQGISLIEEYGTGIVGAYNLTPGGAIYAGQVAAIPEPAFVPTGLALFALGAVGVREHRRRRQAVGSGNVTSDK